MRSVWTLLLLLATASAASAAPTTLYVHLNDFQDAPISPQAPAPDFVQSSDIGLIQHSQTCVNNPAGSAMSEGNHDVFGFATTSFIDYDDGRPRYHNERGLAMNAHVNGTVSFWWYLETQVTSNDAEPDVNVAPVWVPRVELRAELREGTPVVPDHENFLAGRLIASGSQGPVDLHPTLHSDDVTYTEWNGRHVYGFHFEMPLEANLIRAAPGFELHVQVRLDNPVCNSDDYLMPDFVRTHSSPDMRPRFTLDVDEPLRIVHMVPQVIGDDVLFYADYGTPWGHYSVVPADDPARTPGTFHLLGQGMDQNLDGETLAVYTSHNDPTGSNEPTRTLWVWEGGALHRGEYTGTAQLQDLQGNTANATIRFVVGDGTMDVREVCTSNGCAAAKPMDATQQTPGPGLLLVPLLGLLARRFR